MPLTLSQLEQFHGAGAFAIGLLATLVLASLLTPRRWWRRANARALAILAGGSWGIGSLILWLAQGVAPSSPPSAAPMPLAQTPAPRPAPAGPQPGQAYRVIEDLNLRNSATVGAPRIGVVPGGAVVHATGAHQGDWWQISTGAPETGQTGWASSLWLRRSGETAHR